MKMKTALWMAALTCSLAIAGQGTCLAQSEIANGANQERPEFAQAPSGELIAATVPPDAAGYTLDTAGSQPAEPAPKGPGQATSFRIGIGVKVSTLGAGIEAAVPVAGKLNVRGGFNMFRYNRGITDNGIQYAGKLQFQSAEAHLDYFPFGGFHISPGLLIYNGNQLTAAATVPGGQTFSLNGTSYESDPGTPVTGAGKLDFVKVSPSIMVGVGNLIPRSGRHWSILFEVGGAYQGSARVALNLTGNVCDTTGLNCRAISSDSTVQSNITAQQNKISKDLNPYRFFPILSLGVGFNF